MRSTINDYFFYKIVNINGDCDLCYVGSTANWGRRLQCHKSSCHNKNSPRYNYKLYQMIRANGGWCEFKMVEIGKAEQLTQRQAHAIEETYRSALKADMNSRRCFVTLETAKEQKKQYKIDNAEIIKEYQKQYRIDNAEKRKEQNKQYRIDNAEKISAHKNEKHNCTCGGKYTTSGLSRHIKTKKHQTYIKNNPIKIDTCIECEN